MARKILVIGKARHGKDTFCEMLAEATGLKFASSSEFVAERAVYPVLMPRYGYASKAEAYADRVNHRNEWRDLIREYNTPDAARLARELLAENDIYCGMRHIDEFNAARGLFDVVVYVDASGRVGGEDESMMIPRDVADCEVSNNGTLAALRGSVTAFIDWLNDWETNFGGI